MESEKLGTPQENERFLRVLLYQIESDHAGNGVQGNEGVQLHALH